MKGSAIPQTRTARAGTAAVNWLAVAWLVVCWLTATTSALGAERDCGAIAQGPVSLGQILDGAVTNDSDGIPTDEPPG